MNFKLNTYYFERQMSLHSEQNIYQNEPLARHTNTCNKSSAKITISTNFPFSQHHFGIFESAQTNRCYRI